MLLSLKSWVYVLSWICWGLCGYSDWWNMAEETSCHILPLGVLILEIQSCHVRTVIILLERLHEEVLRTPNEGEWPSGHSCQGTWNASEDTVDLLDQLSWQLNIYSNSIWCHLEQKNHSVKWALNSWPNNHGHSTITVVLSYQVAVVCNVVDN